jgi:hypothetical protein
MYTNHRQTAIPHRFVLGLLALVTLGPYGCVVEEAEPEEEPPLWVVTDDETEDVSSPDRSKPDGRAAPYRDTGVSRSRPHADTREERNDREERDAGAPVVVDAGHRGGSPTTDAADPDPLRMDTGRMHEDTGGSTRDAGRPDVADASIDDAHTDASDTSDCLLPGLCDDSERDGGTTSDAGSGPDTSNTCDGGACNTGPPRGIDLSGRWLAKGYGCRIDHLEVVDIEHTRQKLVATKRVGNPCIQAGKKVFRKTNPGRLSAYSNVDVEGRYHSLDGTSLSWGSATLEILSEDHLELANGTIVLRRADTTNLGTVNLSGNWKAESYRCRGNYLKSSMTLRQTSGHLVGEPTGGRNCLVKWKGKRSGNQFSVDITVLDANGNHNTIPGTATILAHSFILVEPTYRFWNIRMREASFF